MSFWQQLFGVADSVNWTETIYSHSSHIERAYQLKLGLTLSEDDDGIEFVVERRVERLRAANEVPWEAAGDARMPDGNAASRCTHRTREYAVFYSNADFERYPSKERISVKPEIEFGNFWPSGPSEERV